MDSSCSARDRQSPASDDQVTVLAFVYAGAMIVCELTDDACARIAPIIEVGRC